MKVEIHETIDSPWGPLHCVASAEQRVVATVVETTDPYPSDLLAAIPWAKDVGLELKWEEGAWVFCCGGKFYCQVAMKWTNHHAPHSTCGHETREDALRFPPPKPPGVVEASAQPSVGERLSQVLYHAYTGCMMQQPGAHWEKAALAVRREVFKEPWTEGDVLEAAKAAIRQFSGGKWKLHMQSKVLSAQWLDIASAALSAALASRVERAEREGSK